MSERCSHPDGRFALILREEDEEGEEAILCRDCSHWAVLTKAKSKWASDIIDSEDDERIEELRAFSRRIIEERGYEVYLDEEWQKLFEEVENVR